MVESENNWTVSRKPQVVIRKNLQNFNRQTGHYYLSHLSNDLLLGLKARNMGESSWGD